MNFSFPKILKKVAFVAVVLITGFSLAILKTQAQAIPMPISVTIDDGGPGFVKDGLTDDDQPAYWATINSGNGGSAIYTGNSVNANRHNWATWTATGVTGTLEVSVTIPAGDYFSEGGRVIPLTEEASYKVTSASGEETVKINQRANEGKTVSLGTFTFNGTGSVYLDDRVKESGSFFLSAVVVDAAIFGAPKDTIPPKIEKVIPVVYNGEFFIEATVTDNVAVKEVVLFYNGQEIPMVLKENGKKKNVYAAKIGTSFNSKLEYFIVAKDTSGNTTQWSSKRGLILRGALISSLGYTPGILTRKNTKYLNPSLPNDPCGGCDDQLMGDPVNPINGNLIAQEKIFVMPGRPEVDFHLTYNSQSNALSIFGESWVHSYQYHLVEMDNVVFQGAFVQYPDGALVKFSGENFEAEPGYLEKLTRDGDGYILTFKDLSRAKFDAEGDIIRWEDANGNGINFSYGSKEPYTLMSQLKSIKADGGREITLEYNGEGLVKSASAPEGKTVNFEYNNDDLTKIIDAKGGQTVLEYKEHLLTKETTPNGSIRTQNNYDDKNRVTSQSFGAAVKFDFAYSDGQTVSTDANGKTIIYKHANNTVTSITNQVGKTTNYEYDAKKNLISYTDRDGNKYTYGYDANGNRTFEKDPMSFETKRTFNTSFNKVLSETYKQDDHVTKYDYDAKGNLLKVTNAEGKTAHYGYNNFGQLIEYKNFNGHSTHYAYTGAGDVDKVTNAVGKTTDYAYDGFGRRIKLTNPRGFSYQYSYDKNDNLTQISGPLGYSEKFGYDANSLLIGYTNPNGKAEAFSYDASGNLIKAVDFMGFESNYAYGKMNEKLTKVDAMGRVTVYTNDNTYFVTQVKEAAGTPDEITTTFTYNQTGANTSVTNPNNILNKFELDPLHRVKTIIKNAVGGDANSEKNVSTNYDYSATDKIVKETDSNGNVTVYTYDKLDRLIKQVDAENQTTNYDYDSEGNLVKVINPKGFETKYEYDGMNRLTKTTDAKGGVSKITYDPNGNVDAKIDANAVVTKFGYDELDRNVEKVENFFSGGAVDEKTNVSTKYSYDLNGNVLTEINPRKFPRTNTYDANNRLVNVRDALDHVAELSYDKVGNLLSIKDRNTHVTSFTYDNLNRLTKETDPEGHAISYTYDKNSNTTQKIDARGKKYSQAFDALDRLTVETDPYNKTKVYAYDAMGNKLSEADENTHVSKYDYDKVYRLRKETDAENFATAYEYDPNSNITKLIDGNNNPTLFGYDELDRLINKTNAENEVEKYGYDAVSNRILLTEADNTQHKFSFDPLYRLAEVIDNFKEGQPAKVDTNVSTKYSYDANGNLTKVLDALNHPTAFEYDALDRKSVETNALGKQWKYAYDNETNIINRTDAIGVQTKYAYAADNQLKQIQYLTHKVDYAYDENHNVLSMQDNLGKSSWNYDDLNRMTSQSDPFNRKLGYEYDPVGNLTKLSYPDQRNMSYNYKKNNWLAKAQSSDKDSVEYARNGVGLATKLTKSNSSYETIAYDKVYRKLEVLDQQVGNGDHLINKFNYKYNLVGDIVKENSDYGVGQFKKIDAEYAYDGLHRLTVSNSTDAQSSIYEYDAVGNRTRLQEYIPNKQAFETRTYAYNEINSLLSVNIDSPMPPNKVNYSYKYDNNGNRVDALKHDNTGVDIGTRYSYDNENRLTKAQDYKGQLDKKGNMQFNDMAHTDMEYDGYGRRLSSTYYPGASKPGQRTEYTFDKLDPIVETNMENKQRVNFYRDIEQNLLFNQEFKSENAPNGTSYWYHMDGRGNIATVSKFDAQSDHSYKYDEYGTVIPDSGKWVGHNNTFSTSQKEFDPNTGLHYFGSRFYDSSTGTWMNQDSYRGEITKPSTLHRYMYNLDNPVNYVDRYGYSSESVNYSSNLPQLYQNRKDSQGDLPRDWRETTCGPTALTMILNAYGIPVTKNDVAKYAYDNKLYLPHDPNKVFTSPEDLAKLARYFVRIHKGMTYRVESGSTTYEYLKERVNSGTPVIVDLRIGAGVQISATGGGSHFAVVERIENGTVYLKNPYDGSQSSVTETLFKGAWEDVPRDNVKSWYLLIKPSGPIDPPMYRSPTYQWNA